MKLGLVIHSSEVETVWNAFRLGVSALERGDAVRAFLLARGVECETMDDERFDVRGQMESFVAAGGEILACGTCLKIRQSEGSELCPLSTMQDLYELIGDSDKIVSF